MKSTNIDESYLLPMLLIPRPPSLFGKVTVNIEAQVPKSFEHPFC